MSTEQAGDSGTGQSDELRRRRRKVKVILAVGIIVGLGAVATLAGYTTSIFGGASFATGEGSGFNVLGSFDGGTTWESYASAGDAGQFEFQINPGLMTPGDTVYAPVALKIDPTQNSSPGDAVLKGAQFEAGSNPLQIALIYTVKSLPAAACNATGFGAGTVPPTFPEGVALTVGSGATPLRLTADSAPQNLCFAVTLPSSYSDDQSIQGLSTGKVTWGFDISSATT
ncbi:hypothetical protein OG921_09560 [Aldersonia sp. NBC_00410]|uniref:hypothetical protein n=1 Tax=Aldersonia sp. NBC_00410 TaxID=2975954 RepID=UPI00224EB1A9|nr:hypothetical protein [Aldersonia sp. NBC_00410]MCX5043417.1 hypothetical protein [Aldersonia sp. NBC_00410]